MFRTSQPALAVFAATAILGLGGCTSFSDYVHNGFKVGPNYQPARAEVAPNWIDASDLRVRNSSDDLSKWWAVFNDPALDSLICYAYQQNLSLKVAGCRVLEARAQLAIDAGNLFPQTQTATGSYMANALSRENANPLASGVKRFYPQWNYGFNLSWELDFWGRLRQGHRIRCRQHGCIGRKLRRRAGHALGRRSDELCGVSHDRAENQLRQGERRPPAQDIEDRRRATESWHRRRARRGPGAKHAGANRGHAPRVGDCLAHVCQPALHLVGHSSSRPASPAWIRVDSQGASGSRRRHPGGFVATPARRPPRRAASSRSGRANRHRPVPILSVHLDQWHLGLLRPELQQSLPGTGPGGQYRSCLHVEHSQLWPPLE